MIQHRRLIILTICAMASFASAILAQSYSVRLPQPNDYPNPFAGPITSPRPLRDVAQWVERKYGKVVTYEEAIPRFRGDLVQFGTDTTRKWSLDAVPVQVDVSTLLAGASAQNLPDILTEVVSVVNTRVPTQHFILKSSDLGFHIIMDKERDEGGRLVEVQPFLDATITVPTAERSVEDTFKELSNAIRQATGTYIEVNSGSSELFSGGEPPDLTWGVQNVAARDALISLLGHSATTLSWQLLCGASAQASDELCVLSTTAVLVIATDCSGQPILRGLLYDRCKRCPRLLAPPPCSSQPPPPSQ